MSVMMMIGADVVPRKSNFALFSGDGAKLLDDALRAEWLSADFRVVNLEAPLTDAEKPIAKCGMALKAPKSCANGFAALRIDAAGICNNHIFDYGEAGLSDTLDALKVAGVPAFGAGRNASQADEPLYLVKNGMRIGLYAVCEHEFSCADGQSPGANGLNELMLCDRIRSIRHNCDRLVVLFHGGREYYPYPSPLLMARCRRMVECGADAVLCQHSHCIGAQEVYLDRPIVYGQGNFLFDMDDEPCFETGLVVQLLFTGEDRTVAHYLPVCRKSHGAALVKGDAATKILGAFFARSEEIASPGFVREHYRAYAVEQREKLLKVFLSGNLLLKILCRLYGRKPTRVYSRAAQLAIKNSLTCESIRELLTQSLEEE